MRIAASVLVVLSLLVVGAPAAGASDEVLPTPTVSGSNPTSPANNNFARILGSAPAGSTVRLYDNDLCDGAPAASGSAANFASVGLGVFVPNDSTTTFHASVTDADGHMSACSTGSFLYVEDSTNPEPPVFIGSNPASPAAATTPALRGSAEAGSSVLLFDNAACIGAPVASGSAQSFSSPGLTVTVAHDSRTSFGAVAQDGAGNVSDCSNPFVYAEDSTPPPAPRAPDLASSSDTGASSTDDLTNDTAPTFTGVVEAGATVRLYVRGMLVGSDVAADGNYAVSVVTPLSSGLYDAAVQVTDRAGNMGARSAPLVFIVDTVAPTATLDAVPRDASTDASPTFSFWSSEGQVTYECSLTGGTSFSACASPVSYDALPDAGYTFAVRATDRAGNTGPVQSYGFLIDGTLAPDVIPPTHTLVMGAHLGSGSIPVRIRWSGQDPEGISRYELQQSSDGGRTYTNVSLGSDLATSTTVQLSANDDLYRFRVRATDSRGDMSGWIEGAAFTLIAHQETSPAIDFPGLWTRSSLPSSFGGWVRYSTSGSARATLTFSGSQVAWVAERNSNRGRAMVWLDGERVATVDLYSPRKRARQIVFSRTVPPGAHQLEVRVLGKRISDSSNERVDVDAFLVVH